MRIEKLDQNTKKNLLEDLLKRSPGSYGKYEENVRVILDAVKDRGDEALFEYTKKFDGADINASNILVTEDEIKEAYEAVDSGLIEVIRKALANIRSYHEKQMQYSWFDPGAEGDSARKSGSLCAGRKGGISVFRPYEHHARKGGRSGRDHYGDASRKRREGDSHNSCRGKGSRC